MDVEAVGELELKGKGKHAAEGALELVLDTAAQKVGRIVGSQERGGDFFGQVKGDEEAVAVSSGFVGNGVDLMSP